METYISINFFVRCLFLSMLLVPFSSFAYDDTNPLRAHSPINTAAIQYFEQYLLPNDKFLKASEASFNGQAVWGYGWDRMEDGGPAPSIFAPMARPDIRKAKRMKAWIINGGFSADEPEGTTALVHFYDPMAATGSRFLSDQLFISRALKALNSLNTNPELDARQWGITDVSNDTGIYGENFIQDYSFDDAKINLTKALESKDRTNENYGRAWRGIGETMHMVADMTVPAHVRNDGHATALLDADPYENSTSETHVNEYATNLPAELNYKTDIMTLMDTVAKFTNNNFFSKDTIPGQPGSLTKYSLPNIATMVPDSKGYLIDASGRCAAAPVTWRQKLFNSSLVYTTNNSRVLSEQRSILIPTAVRADAAVLDRFLPRFIVSQSVSPDPANPTAGKYVMQASIKRADEAWNRMEWQNKLVVNNGATIVLTAIDGKVTNIPIDPAKLLNGMTEFSYTFDANPTDKVELMYDLGGYIVRATTTCGRYQEVSGTNGSVMKDSVTGFEWQRCRSGQTWNNVTKKCDGTALLYNASDAFNLTMTGGWRTPTNYEIGTLTYCADSSFPVDPSWFWTSSSWYFCVGESCQDIPYAATYKESMQADPKNQLPVRLIHVP